MPNQLINTILEIDDVQALQVDFSQLKKIPRQNAISSQIIIYYKDEENFVHILTTNNYPEELKKILKQLDNKWLKYKVYYTSAEWFAEWIKWYDQLEAQEQKAIEEKEMREKAEWDSAISLMKQFFTKKDTLDPGEFILETVRLWFQSWASDMHFQPEWKNVVLRLRLDGILQDVVSFDSQDRKSSSYLE